MKGRWINVMKSLPSHLYISKAWKSTSSPGLNTNSSSVSLRWYEWRWFTNSTVVKIFPTRSKFALIGRIRVILTNNGICSACTRSRMKKSPAAYLTEFKMMCLHFQSFSSTTTGISKLWKWACKFTGCSRRDNSLAAIGTSSSVMIFETATPNTAEVDFFLLESDKCSQSYWWFQQLS